MFRNLKFTWRNLLDIASFIVIFITAILIILQLQDAKEQARITTKTVSELLTQQFNVQLSNSVNTGIVAVIDSEKPILKEHSGSFTDYQLDNYLGMYEVMDGAYLEKQITQDDFCSIFSFYLDPAYKNKEIQTYIDEQNKIYKRNDLFSGFQDLAQKSLKDCH